MMSTVFRRLTVFAALWLSLMSIGSAYFVQQGEIYADAAEEPLQLRGVNWFGFETQDHVAHGLWSRNWKEMILQMKDLGFNAVRVPVCPATLHGTGVGSIDYSKNADLQGMNSLQILDTVLNELSNQEMYILLDHHRPDCNAISELWYVNGYTETNWINDLVLMADRYEALPYFLGIDLKNEPHGQVTWGTGNSATDWDGAAERASAAVLNANPEILVFVEGIQENPSCSGTVNHWWGGNLEPLNCAPLDIPADRLVLSPHVYGPDVYFQPYFSDSNFPNNMPTIWDAHFGQFVGEYVLAVGEWGGKYGAHHAADRVWQDAFVDYMIDTGMRHSFYWSWNPNSGDTGGILKDDWNTVHTDKMALLERLWAGTADGAGGTGGNTGGGDGGGDGSGGGDGGGTDGSGGGDGTGGTDGSGGGDGGGTGGTNDGEVFVTITNAWNSGYCAELSIRPEADIIDWTVTLTIQGTLSASWNAHYTVNGSTTVVTPYDWNSVVPAGNTAVVGFCANSSSANPSVTDYELETETVAPPMSSGNFEAAVTVNNRWGTGYCADVSLRNTGNSSYNWEYVVLDMSSDTINDLWNGVRTNIGNGQVRVTPYDWNRTIGANSVVTFGFCANGNGTPAISAAQ